MTAPRCSKPLLGRDQLKSISKIGRRRKGLEKDLDSPDFEAMAIPLYMRDVFSRMIHL
jgi:hypothetical protein